MSKTRRRGLMLVLLVAAPNVGLEVLVPTQYVERGRDGDTRPALEPHVRVELSSADWLAGRDPVLQAALR
jgi:hypothetical protein